MCLVCWFGVGWIVDMLTVTTDFFLQNASKVCRSVYLSVCWPEKRFFRQANKRMTSFIQKNDNEHPSNQRPNHHQQQPQQPQHLVLILLLFSYTSIDLVTMMILLTITAVPLGLLLIGYILLVVITFVLAAITTVRGKFQKSQSALYEGRVWHTRFHPVKHGFSYPIFVACIDLQDNDSENDDFQEALYPLSSVMALRDSDHYKNGEGLTTDGRMATTTTTTPSLMRRTIHLVNERTKQKTGFSPLTHSVKLITHLRYYGYCFNPVSFYYVLKKKEMKETISKQSDNDNSNDNSNNDSNGAKDGELDVIEAVVAEVSNTPWNEMQCYVLHPDSVDMKTVKETEGSVNYLFDKAFHVSPFMDMDHEYDWTFWHERTNEREGGNNDTKTGDTRPTATTTTNATTTTTGVTNTNTHSNTLRITTNMKKEKKLFFSAHLNVQNRGLHPMMLAQRLILFPIFCFIIQLWIHYEAFWLFVKGVAYVPHPKGSETTASRWIGNAMAPLFALQEWFDRNKSDTKKEA